MEKEFVKKDFDYLENYLLREMREEFRRSKGVETEEYLVICRALEKLYSIENYLEK